MRTLARIALVVGIAWTFLAIATMAGASNSSSPGFQLIVGIGLMVWGKTTLQKT